MDGVNAKLYKYNVLLKHSIQKLLYIMVLKLQNFKNAMMEE